MSNKQEAIYMSYRGSIADCWKRICYENRDEFDFLVTLWHEMLTKLYGFIPIESDLAGFLNYLSTLKNS